MAQGVGAESDDGNILFRIKAEECNATRAARSPVAPKELTPTLFPRSAAALGISGRDIKECMTREKSKLRLRTGTPRIAPRIIVPVL